MRKAVVVDDDPIIRMDLVDILGKNGFEIVGQGGDGFDAVDLCTNHHPDLVLMDIKMPIFDGLDAAKTIMKNNLAGCVVIVTAFKDDDFIEKAKQLGVSGYLVKPVDERILLPTVEIALAQSERYRQMQGENDSVRKKLEQKALLDRAKAVLARKSGISESDAYAMIQKMSMDKSVDMVEVARMLVESNTDRESVDDAKKILMDRFKIGENAAYRKIREASIQKGCSIMQAARDLIAQYVK